MSATRGIDHLVIAVDDLDAARDRYSAFGFLTTPLGRQPWGTANHLVQFPRNFIELVGVLDRSGIVPMSDDHFSFSAQIDRFLRGRQGMCMLVLTTEDARADASEWRSRGLDVYEPFHWSRNATLPDGSETTVAFTLTFVTDPDMPEIAFFSCQQHNPEAFWKPEYQAHGNGALGISGVTLVAEDPSAHGAFVTKLVGDTRALEDGDGVRIPTAGGLIRIQSPSGFHARFPAAVPPAAGGRVGFLAATVRVDDADRVAGCLDDSGVVFFRGAGSSGEGTVYVADACGVVLEFAAA